MKPGEYRLKRQTNSPYWAADYLEWNAQKGEWVRKITSTKEADEGKAHVVASAKANTAREIHQATQTGWSRPKAMALVNDMLKAAGLPILKPVQSWKSFADGWLAAKKLQVGPRTYDKYKHDVDLFETFLGAKTKLGIDTITPPDCGKYKATLEAKGLLPVSVNYTMLTIRTIFKRAVAEGECSINPTVFIPINTDTDPRLLRSVYTADEITKIIKFAGSTEQSREWVTMVLLGICTGARIRDCAGMMWSHVNKATWTLTYMPAKTKRKKRLVTVPVVEPLLSHLKALEKSATALYLCPKLSTALHPSRLFGKLLDKAGIEQGIVGVRKKTAGVNWRQKSFHSLRHTLPSWLKAAGVDIETRMAIVGHTSKEVHKGYTHIEMKAITDALDGALGKLVS
jgi:integrase